MSVGVGILRATFTRSCRTCRGAGEMGGSAGELRAWINEHDDLVIERARAARAYQQATASWAEVEQASLAVALHRLVAPGELCEACAGAGQVLRRRNRPGGRR